MTARKSPARSTVEALEVRIAPAFLIIGANLLGGTGNPTTGESSLGGNSVTVIGVLSGQAIAWYDGTHITEVSFGPNTRLELTGDVGDLVGNLTAAGRLSDSDHNPVNGEDGNILLANNLLGVTTHQIGAERGDIDSIITGGSVAGLNVNGHLHGIYAGDGAFRAESARLAGGAVASDTHLTVNPVDPGSATGFSFTRATAQMKASAPIANLTIAIADELQVIAGSGAPTGVAATGLGAVGGSISNVHISSAILEAGGGVTPSYTLLAGSGGAGKSGGAGGQVFNVLEDTSTNIVRIRGGDGGDGGLKGAGGAGGSVHDLDMQGDSAAYSLQGGAGGQGKIGGAGGGMTRLNFAGQKPNSGVILAADFTGDGLDDILVVDANTGDMVISQAIDNGANFQPVVQYYDTLNQPVTKIAGAGSTPSGAVAVDFDQDGDLDIIVSYKNSNSLAFFLNGGRGNPDPVVGHGSFYDASASEFAVGLAQLTYSPEKLAVTGPSGNLRLTLAENVGGRGIVHFIKEDPTRVDNHTIYTLVPEDFTLKVNSAVTALISAATPGGPTVIGGTYNGSLFSIESASEVDASFRLTVAGQTVVGGVASLDVDGGFDTLVATSSGGHLVQTFAIGDDGSLALNSTVDLSAQKGRTISARFVKGAGNVAGDALALLSVSTAGSQLGFYTPHLDGDTVSYDQTRQATTTYALKNFVVAYDTTVNGQISTFGLAALGGALNRFTYSAEVGEAVEVGLPFTGKTISLAAGRGGLGLLATMGGAGGTISAINVQATDINLQAGDGGQSETGPGGAGGSISNPPSFVSYSLQTIVPGLSAENQPAAGGRQWRQPRKQRHGHGQRRRRWQPDGPEGDAGYGRFRGPGGFRRGGARRRRGQWRQRQRRLGFSPPAAACRWPAGAGGNAMSGKARAGVGGAIANVSFTLTLEDDAELVEQPYAISFGHRRGR